MPAKGSGKSTVTPLSILVIGAHPDDDEIKAGGAAAHWARAGHRVRFVSGTNGCSGHHEIGGVELVRRRVAEAQAAADVIGIESQVLDLPDGELVPSIENRKRILQLIREFKPDLILSHRLNDYHPDHRALAQLIQDCSYLCTVPNVLPQTPVMRKMPVIAYLYDHFQKPNPFQPDVVVGIDEFINEKMKMLHCHVTQFYEWLPWNDRIENQVPKSDKERLAWLGERRLKIDEACANAYRDKLIERYGKEKGSKIRYAEAFEGCEYGARLTPELAKTLFPF